MTLLSLLPRVEPRMSHEPMHWCLNLKRSSACTNVSLLNLASVEPTDSSVTDSITDDSGLLALPSTSPLPPLLRQQGDGALNWSVVAEYLLNGVTQFLCSGANGKNSFAEIMLPLIHPQPVQGA